MLTAMRAPPEDLYGFRALRGAGLSTLVVRAELDKRRRNGEPCMVLAFDVGAAFDSALKDVTRTVLQTVGCPEWWMRAKENLWRDMSAKLWLDGEEVGRVEWANGVLQGGVCSPADYAAFTIYVRERVADEFRSRPIVQAWVADDSLFLVDPAQANHLASFLVQEYHDLFMEVRAAGLGFRCSAVLGAQLLGLYWVLPPPP